MELDDCGMWIDRPIDEADWLTEEECPMPPAVPAEWLEDAGIDARDGSIAAPASDGHRDPASGVGRYAARRPESPARGRCDARTGERRAIAHRRSVQRRWRHAATARDRVLPKLGSSRGRHGQVRVTSGRGSTTIRSRASREGRSRRSRRPRGRTARVRRQRPDPAAVQGRRRPCGNRPLRLEFSREQQKMNYGDTPGSTFPPNGPPTAARRQDSRGSIMSISTEKTNSVRPNSPRC